MSSVRRVILAWLAILGGQGPWSVDVRHPVWREPPPVRQSNHSFDRVGEQPFLGVAIAFYGHWLTAVDGPRCHHRPTCARYAHQALIRYGLVRGGWRALDRWLRGARSSRLRPLLTGSDAGGVFFLDPLD